MKNSICGILRVCIRILWKVYCVSGQPKGELINFERRENKNLWLATQIKAGELKSLDNLMGGKLV